MATGARLGSFADLMAGVGPGVAEIARDLRALILQVHPTAVEVVRLGDRAASFGVGPKKMTEAHTYIMPQRRHVNLGFYRGATLPDPERLLEGTGRAMRHVKIGRPAEVRRPALRRLIEAALAESLCYAASAHHPVYQSPLKNGATS